MTRKFCSQTEIAFPFKRVYVPNIGIAYELPYNKYILSESPGNYLTYLQVIVVGRMPEDPNTFFCRLNYAALPFDEETNKEIMAWIDILPFERQPYSFFWSFAIDPEEKIEQINYYLVDSYIDTCERPLLGAYELVTRDNEYLYSLKVDHNPVEGFRYFNDHQFSTVGEVDKEGYVRGKLNLGLLSNRDIYRLKRLSKKEQFYLYWKITSKMKFKY